MNGLYIASLNMRGSRATGKQREIELWMSHARVDVLCVQETHEGETKEVVSGQYTWTFSGGEQNGAISTRVAIVIKSEHRNCLLKDEKTVNDRLMWMQLKGIKPITIVSCYAPTGAAEYDTKVCFYNSLHETVRETRGSGMIFIGGDFNVRLRSDDVCGVKIGPHIFR